MKKTSWMRVQLAREPMRPTAVYYINNIFPDFIELHGDRSLGDDPAVIGGIASFGGRPVTVIAQEKGVGTQDKIQHNFGSPKPEGYRKSMRLMKQAEKFGRPVIFFVDTPGAHCGTDAERYGVGESIAKNLFELSKLKVPVITVILGEGGSGGALAFAVSDRLAMLENSIYSILSPEGFASILWKDKSKAESASVLMKLTAQDALDHGIIDTVIPEPTHGAKSDDNGAMAKSVSEYIEKCLDELSGLTVKKLLSERNKRFRDYGKKNIKGNRT